MFRKLAPLGVLAAVVLAGCGASPSTRTVTRTVTTTVTAPKVTYIPPESSVTPDGAKPGKPPLIGLTPGVALMHIDATGLHLIESFEGYDRCAYFDPYGGVWTAGFGQTQGVYPGFCFASRAAAEANLKLSVEETYEPSIRALDVSFNQHQWDALCSFTYNLGAGIFDGTAVGYDLRARDFTAATKAMLGYVYAGGVVLPGLVTRRREEVDLFNTPVVKPRPYVPADELRWRHEWDQVSGKHTAHEDAVRARLRPWMLKRAHIIEYRAHHERDGWLKLNRQARHYELNVRLGLVKAHR